MARLSRIPTDEITAKYPCVTTSTEMKLQSIQTIFGTNIPGLAAVESELVKNPLSGREVSLDPITSITVTIPKDTPAGTYKIYGGYVKLRRGDPAWSITTENLYERQIQDVELTVLPATDYSDIYTTTGDYIASLGTPTVGSVGGEWMALGLARSGRTVPSGYYDNVVKYVKENIDSNGRLDRTKTTENARVILALTAIGKDPTNVGGYNLLDGFYNMKGCLLGQGVNAPIFALLALDSHNYTPTHDDVTRESLVELILSDQVKADGGWALEGATAEASDVDMTAMAIQALAPYYKTNANVKSAVDKALGLLSTMQQPDGGYASWGTVNSESCAQVIVALTALGIDPTVDSRFIKNGISVLDALCSYYVTGGGFSHTSGEGRDGMATEQGYYALAAYYLKMYPCLKNRPDVLKVLTQSDRKMKYIEKDLKNDTERLDKESNAVKHIPSREVSFESLGKHQRKQIVDTSESVEDQVLRHEANRHLWCALEKLEEAERELILAYYYRGLTERECAEKIGITQPSVNAQRRRILKKLKRFLEI